MPHVFDHRPTAQEVFDAACTFFVNQPGPAIDDAACRYRIGDRCCAAGYFIPDDKYQPGMDNMEGGNGVRNLVEIYGAVLPNWFEEHARLLSRLQTVHDAYDNRRIIAGNLWNYNNLATALRDVAEWFLLDANAVEKVAERADIPDGWNVVEA